MSRPRVLLVKPIVPYPPDQGTKVVTFDLIRALHEEFDVTVLARELDASDARAARELESWCGRVVTVVPGNRRSIVHRVAYKAWYSLVSLVTRRSLKSLYDCPGSLVAAARRLARDENFDLVVLEYWQLYPLFDVFDPRRTVLFTHDIDLDVNRESALLEKRVWRKLTAVRRWMVERREEVAAYRCSTRILALTERDAAAARALSLGRAEVHVLPFGVDPDHFAPDGSVARRREVLFMGALGASFNRDALVFFARSVFPLLDDVDELEVSIVGGALPPEAAALATDPRVRVVGRVDDVRPWLHRAACIVIPLRFGGGLRIRTIEAMMAGLPVVCSTVAMAGMDFEPERHYLLADDAAATAGAVQRILDDPASAAAMAERAREHALSRYGPGAGAATRALFHSIAGQ